MLNPHRQYKAQFIGVTVVSALALTYAYVLVGSTHEAKLLATRCVTWVDGKHACPCPLMRWLVGVVTYSYIHIDRMHRYHRYDGREVEGKRGGKEGRAAAEAAMAGSTNLESLSYALFVVNALYLVRAYVTFC